MEKYVNPHMQEWQRYVNLMTESMKDNNIEDTERYKALVEEQYNKYKDDVEKMNACVNFESCNQAIQDALPRLIKENTNAVKEIINEIKNDKNLSAQQLFFASLSNYNATDATQYIQEALALVEAKIDRKTLKQSNEKLVNLVRKYGIIPENKFTENQVKLFENCDYLLAHKKKISNLNEYSNKLKWVSNYVQNNIKPINEKKEDIGKLIEDYNKKYLPILNEEEKSFVQEIMDFKKGYDSQKKKSLFEKMKGDCLNGVEKLLENCTTDTEKAELMTIKEEITSKVFNETTLVQDMAKLLELRDILLDK